MPRQIHAVVQDAQHLDHTILLMDAKDQQMPPLVAVPGNMQRGNAVTQFWTPAHVMQLRTLSQSLKGIVNHTLVEMSI
jgi:hypothetical protein